MEDRKPEPVAALEITINGEVKGELKIKLKINEVPDTVKNFLHLCNGVNIDGEVSYSYRGAPFHRIIPGFMCQGGDFEHGNGFGGRSVFGLFSHENHTLVHGKKGDVAMAGAQSIGSQFYIIFGEAHQLDGDFVVFGEVEKSSFHILDLIEQEGCVDADDGEPRNTVVISRSGQMVNGQPSWSMAKEFNWLGRKCVDYNNDDDGDIPLVGTDYLV